MIVRVTQPSVPRWVGHVVPCDLPTQEGRLRFTCVEDRGRAHEFSADEALTAALWLTEHHKKQGFKVVCEAVGGEPFGTSE